MSNTTKAATVASNEQVFFAEQTERAMQLDGVSTQGAMEQPEDGDEMFQRLRSEYKMTKGRGSARKETGKILKLLDRENGNKEWFENLEMGPNFEAILKRGCYCRETGHGQDKDAVNMSTCLMRAKENEMEAGKCHLCEEAAEGVKRETRAEMSMDAIKGRMVLVEIEQAEGEAPYYALRYMDQGTQAFMTFAPTRDAYNLFAVSMRITQIARSTRRALCNEVKKTTALSIPKLGLNNAVVGADNIMQAVELCDMSEYIQAMERKEYTLL